jgi:hypothetical protein
MEDDARSTDAAFPEMDAALRALTRRLHRRAARARTTEGHHPEPFDTVQALTATCHKPYMRWPKTLGVDVSRPIGCLRLKLITVNVDILLSFDVAVIVTICAVINLRP